MLLSILQMLDAELDRLKRLREIVAELGTPSPNAASFAGVATLLAKPERLAVEALHNEGDPAEVEEQATPAFLHSPEIARKRRRRSVETSVLAEAIRSSGESADRPDTKVRPVGAEVDPKVEESLLVENSPAVAEASQTLRKPLPRAGVVHGVKESKPSMVVVSATEAARERASRLARLPAKRGHGEHPGPKPDAAPEDLARDLAARWLSGTGSADPSAQLLDR